MTILSNVDILEFIKTKNLKIKPFAEDQVQAGSVDLHLGNTFRIFKKDNRTIDVTEGTDADKFTEIVNLKEGEYLKLSPGQLVHGITKETLELPVELAGWIEGRSRFARIGLMVHVTSGFIHPGSKGKQVLEISNMSPLPMKLYPSTKICQVVFEEVRKKGKPYRGVFHRQTLP